MWRYILWVAGLGVLFLGMRGYNYATNVHHHQVLPYVWELADPLAGASDAYSQTAPYYPSFFPHLAAAGLKLCPRLPTVMACLYGLMLVVMLSGIAALADALFVEWPLKVLASALVLCCQPLQFHSFFGDDAIFRSYADPSGMAWAVIFWALAFWARGRWTRAFALLGLAANLTPLSALHVGLALAAAFGMRHPPTTPLARKVALRSGAVFFLAASPILMRIALMPRQPSVAAGLWLEALKVWFPFHYFPETWTLGKWLQASAFTGLFGLLLWRLPQGLRRKFGPLLLGSLGVLALGFLARLSGSPLLIRLQFFRVDALLILTGILMAAHIAGERLRPGTSSGVGLGVLLLAAMAHWFYWPLAALAMLALLAERSARRLPYYLTWGLILVAAEWSLRQASLGEAALFNPDKALALLLTPPLLWLASRPLPRPLGGVLRGALLALVFVSPLRLIVNRMEGQPLSNLIPGLAALEGPPDYLQEYGRILSWCRENTRRDSTFLMSPTSPGFREQARRKAVFLWSDGAAMHWLPAYAGLWNELFRDFKGSPQEMQRQWQYFGGRWHPVWWSPEEGRIDPEFKEAMGDAFACLTDEDFARLSRKYGADYIITRADVRPLGLPLIIDGNYYRLYQARGEPPTRPGRRNR